jgi:hypothetical protein
MIFYCRAFLYLINSSYAALNSWKRTDLKTNRDFRSNCDNLCDFNGGHFELFGVAKLAERIHDGLPKYIIRLSEKEKGTVFNVFTIIKTCAQNTIDRHAFTRIANCNARSLLWESETPPPSMCIKLKKEGCRILLFVPSPKNLWKETCAEWTKRTFFQEIVKKRIWAS